MSLAIERRINTSSHRSRIDHSVQCWFEKLRDSLCRRVRVVDKLSMLDIQYDRVGTGLKLFAGNSSTRRAIENLD